MGKMEAVIDFLGLQTLQTMTAAMKLQDVYSLKAMRNLDSMLKSRHITLPTKVNVSQSYGFYSSHVQM